MQGPEDHCDRQPVREVAYDEAREREVPPLLPAAPEKHLDAAEDESHHGREVLHEDEFVPAYVLEHLHQKRRIRRQCVDRQLLDVEDIVYVLLEVPHHRVERLLGLLENLCPELLLHGGGQVLPHGREALAAELKQDGGTAGLHCRAQLVEEVLGLDSFDYLLDREQVADHEVASLRRHDARPPGHDALPAEDRPAAAAVVDGVEAHLDPEPHMPPGEENRHDRDGGVLHFREPSVPVRLCLRLQHAPVHKEVSGRAQENEEDKDVEGVALQAPLGLRHLGGVPCTVLCAEKVGLAGALTPLGLQQDIRHCEGRRKGTARANS
mmetsp:Transcript_23258/g.65060  ORF Transcript_23258/g.65060 Transcript_23258/m.65060 type:complete len:323 (+) Transcript_23258:698-1666(+)